MHRRSALTAPCLALTVAVALAVACTHASADSAGPIASCTSTRPIAVEVSVRDSLSSRAIADSATGVLTAAGVTEDLQRADSLTLLGGEHLGVYSVTIQRPGYRAWTKTGIAVTATAACGNPATVAVTARLELQP